MSDSGKFKIGADEKRQIVDRLQRIESYLAGLGEIGEVDDVAFEMASRGAKNAIRDTEEEIAELLFSDIVKSVDDESAARTVEDAFTDRKIIEKIVKDLMSLDANENDEKMEAITVSLPDLRLKMRHSHSVFSPVVELYAEAMNYHPEFVSAATPLVDHDIFSEDILRIF